MDWKTRIYILIFGLALFLSFGILPLVQSELVIFAYLVLGILAISLIVFAILAGLLAREVLLTKKARRITEQHQSRVISTPHGTWFIAHKDIDVVPLHSTPYLRINGHERDLTPDERFYLESQIPHNRVSDAVGLPLNAVQPSLDLLTIFTQPTQSYAIIAGQQVGKTFQARRIAQYWLSTGCKPIVIGPKWDRDEWEGCTLFGGEYNLQQVSRGMQIVKRLAGDRHSNKNLSHKEHPLQPVFFDDWTAIAAELPEAEEFILKATTLFASVNIIMYFIIHLDTANAWGVQKIGAALKNNFVKLLIYPGYNESGLIDRSRNRGYIIRPGETIKDKKQVALFSGTGSQLLLPDLVIQPTTNEEQAILDMIKGGTPYHTISQAIWGEGKFGQFYNKKIDRIVEKYS